jgi:flagellin-like protein
MRIPTHRPRWRRSRRGISTIIATILIVAITVTCGITLYSLRFRFPSPTVYITYDAKAGLKVPVWGDPTDCTPAGWPQGPGSGWGSAERNAWWNECYDHQVGNFSLMNATAIVISSTAPANMPLTAVSFSFFCHNVTATPSTTTLVTGSLASMTWFPGSTTTPAPNAPHLGWCGSFDANDFGGGAFGTLYNRLGIFIPISQSSDSTLQPGDSFILYVHTSGSVYDPGPPPDGGSIPTGPDADDFHGAPTWCFTTPGACNIVLQYDAGGTVYELANIPVYSISGAGQ